MISINHLIVSPPLARAYKKTVLIGLSIKPGQLDETSLGVCLSSPRREFFLKRKRGLLLLPVWEPVG